MNVQNLSTLAQSQWYSRPADERFETLGDLYARVSSRRDVSYQKDSGLSSLSAYVNDGGGIELFEGGRAGQRLAFNNWSFGQTAGLIGAPANYLRALPAPLAAECLSVGLEKRADEATNGNGAVKLLSYDEGEVRVLQAVTSPSYGRIWDADVVAAVQKIVDRTNGEFYNPKEWGGKPSGLYASDRDMFAFLINGGSIVDGGGERDQLFRGFMVWNSEVGAATLGIADFLFRQCCGNHNIFGMQDARLVKIRHSSGGPERFVNEAIPALTAMVTASAAPLEAKIKAAKAFALPLGRDRVIEFLTDKDFTKSEASRAYAAAEREEGAVGTLWDIYQGMTATARDLAFMDARVGLEKRASKLMAMVA